MLFSYDGGNKSRRAKRRRRKACLGCEVGVEQTRTCTRAKSSCAAAILMRLGAPPLAMLDKVAIGLSGERVRRCAALRMGRDCCAALAEQQTSGMARTAPCGPLEDKIYCRVTCTGSSPVNADQSVCMSCSAPQLAPLLIAALLSGFHASFGRWLRLRRAGIYFIAPKSIRAGSRR